MLSVNVSFLLCALGSEGRNAFPVVYICDYFSHLAQHPRYARLWLRVLEITCKSTTQDVVVRLRVKHHSASIRHHLFLYSVTMTFGADTVSFPRSFGSRFRTTLHLPKLAPLNRFGAGGNRCTLSGLVYVVSVRMFSVPVTRAFRHVPVCAPEDPV